MRRPVRLLVSLSAGAACAALVGCGPSDGGTTCDGLVAGALVISEVQADYAAPAGSSGADTGHEWFEIYNPSTSPVELAGVLLEHMRPTETITNDRHVMGAITIPAGGYLVLGNVIAETAPPHVDYGYGSDLGDLFNTGGGKLRLSCGTTVIDEAVYENVDAGHTRTLDGTQAPDYQTNDNSAAWCASTESTEHEYEPANFGTPGGPNEACMNITPGQCNDGGTMRASVAPVPGDLVITEVMPDPAAVADTAGEWIEVRANRDVDLNGVGVVGASGSPLVVTSTDCVHLAAGSYAVFARNLDPAMNGGLPAAVGQTVSLANAPGSVRVVMGATELDAMSWTTSRSGRSIQLTSTLTGPADNDVAANLCDGDTAYGAGDLGTPGAANRDCGATTDGMCMDMGTGSLRPIVTPTTGQLVINEWMPDPTVVADSAGEWIELRATADVDLNGLQLGDAALATTPAVSATGACVRVATGEFALLAQASTNNGSLPALVGVFPTGVDLVNSAGTAQIAFGGTAIHTVTWTASTPGRSIQIDAAAMQCNAPTGTPAYNGTDIGTPLAANGTCM